MTAIRPTPKPIEAVRIADALHAAHHNRETLPAWLTAAAAAGAVTFAGDELFVTTPDGERTTITTDWLIQGPDGALSVLPDDHFRSVYESTRHHSPLARVMNGEELSTTLAEAAARLRRRHARQTGRLDTLESVVAELSGAVGILSTQITAVALPAEADVLRRTVLEQRAELGACRFDVGCGRFGWRPRLKQGHPAIWERQTTEHLAEVRLRWNANPALSGWGWRVCSRTDPSVALGEGTTNAPREAMNRADLVLAGCP